MCVVGVNGVYDKDGSWAAAKLEGERVGDKYPARLKEVSENLQRSGESSTEKEVRRW